METRIIADKLVTFQENLSQYFSIRISGTTLTDLTHTLQKQMCRSQFSPVSTPQWSYSWLLVRVSHLSLLFYY